MHLLLLLLTLVLALSGHTLAQVNLTKFCLDQDLGNVLAHPRDCRGYIVCNDEPSIHYCEIDFHFDNKRKVCTWPENANCQVSAESEEEQETSSDYSNYSKLMALDVMTGSVVDPMLGYEPENVFCRHFGAYFLPNPIECRTYYLCAYGHMHKHSCGPGTLWSYKAQQCMPNYKANCYHKTEDEEEEIIESLQACNPITTTSEAFHSTGSSYTRTTEEFTTIATNSSPTPSTTTTNRSSHTTEKFHPTGSSYTRTTAAITTPLRVPPTRPQILSSKKPNSSNPFNIICPPKRQSYVAHPKDCGKYFMCIMGTPVLTSCPMGLYWDSKKEYCDLEKNVKCFQ